MMDWQYRQVIGELSLLQGHVADPTCPCVTSDLGEYCVPKHLLTVAALASESATMEPSDARAAVLAELSEDAGKVHDAARAVTCSIDGADAGDVGQWARTWRKRIEPWYYRGAACPLAAGVKVYEAPAAQARREPMPRARRVLGPPLWRGPADTKNLPTDREYSVAICHAPGCPDKISLGAQVLGKDRYSVPVVAKCKNGHTPFAMFHTHPVVPGGGKPIPSAGDYAVARTLGLKVICVGVPETGETACYPVPK